MADFEKLYSEYGTFIFKFLIKYCHNESLAEELTQETFFRAYINLNSLRNEDKAPTWLCQIAKNAYFAWYNEHKCLSPVEEAENAAENDCTEDFITRELTKEALSRLHMLEEPYGEGFYRMFPALNAFLFRFIYAI